MVMVESHLNTFCSSQVVTDHTHMSRLQVRTFWRTSADWSRTHHLNNSADWSSLVYVISILTWDELTCASRWKVGKSCKCLSSTSVCMILQLCKAKVAFFRYQPETLKGFGRLWNPWNNTRVHPFPWWHYCLMWCWQSRMFSFYLLQLSPVCMLKLMLIQNRPCPSWEHSL